MKTMYLLVAVLVLLPRIGNSQQSGECIDTDGDGWGWNKVLKQSCIPPESTNSDRAKPVGVRISWLENPVEEMVDGYTLRLLVNDILATEENTEVTSLNFRFDAINASFSDEICVQVAAFRNEEVSNFSALNCIVIPEQNLPPVSIPGAPAMVWSYD